MKASTILAAESTRALELELLMPGELVDNVLESLVEATSPQEALPTSCFSGEEVSDPDVGETLPSEEELIKLLLLLLLLVLALLLLLLAPLTRFSFWLLAMASMRSRRMLP